MKHPGFAAVQKKVQSEGYSKESAGAIVASAARKASPTAKKANPRLKKVSGGKSFHHQLTGGGFGKPKMC